jgi:hypothetical protein
MLSDQLGEPAATSTGTRVLPTDRQRVPPEAWFQGQGTLPDAAGPAHRRPRDRLADGAPGGMPQGAGRVVMQTPSGKPADRIGGGAGLPLGAVSSPPYDVSGHFDPAQWRRSAWRRRPPRSSTTWGGGRYRWQLWESTGARLSEAPGRGSAGGPAGRRALVEGTRSTQEERDP